MLALALWILLAVAICHGCSLLEATLLSIRLPVLRQQAVAGSRGAGQLLEIKRNRIDDAISLILVLNTWGGTVGASFAGAEAARIFGSDAVGLVSVVLTLLLLVVSEIVPKMLAAQRAAVLAAPVGRILSHLLRLGAPVLVVTRLITQLIAARGGDRMTREELAAVIAAAPREGAISVPEFELLPTWSFCTA